MLYTYNTLNNEYTFGGTAAVFLLNSANPYTIGTTMHEIAQINIARELSRQGKLTYLEYPSPHENGEIDVVAFGAGNPIAWEVKPDGKSGKKQLSKYIENTIFEPGGSMHIRDISIIPGVGSWTGLYMGINGIDGVANYYYYTKDKNGKVVKVNSTVAMIAALAVQTSLKKFSEQAAQVAAAPLVFSIVDGVLGDEVAVGSAYLKAIQSLEPLLRKLVPGN